MVRLEHEGGRDVNERTSPDPRWLEWGKRLQAAAQNGLEYNKDPFNVERYTAVRDIAIEMMTAFTDAEAERIGDLFAGEYGHATPKIDVRGAVIEDGHILLVRERTDGLWSVPGGWADVYDSPAEAAVREIREEAGLQTRAVKLIALYDRSRQDHPPGLYHSYKVFFLCERVSGTLAGSYETTEVGFFPEHTLPPLSVSRVTARQIARCFVHYRERGAPADFD
jgi:ADP-ribose pyrophosphatase YjhB (NUDIX family)